MTDTDEYPAGMDSRDHRMVGRQAAFNTASNFGVALFGYVTIGFAMLLATAEQPSNYRMTYWVLDYELGFVKRGLIGHVTEAAFGSIANTERYITLEVLGTAAGAIFAYCVLAALCTARHRSPEAIAFCLLGLLGAQAVAQFAYDLGRYDQFGFISAVAALLLMRWGKIGMAAGGILMAGAIFAHEAALVIHTPLLLVLAWTERRGPLAIICFGTPVALAGVSVLFYGAPALPPDALLQHYAGEADFPLDPRIFEARTLGEALVAAATVIVNPVYGYKGTGVLLAVILAAWSVLFFYLYRVLASLDCDGRTSWPAVLACYLPLALCIIGVDWYRWLHLVVLNNFILVIYAATALSRDPFSAARAALPSGTSRNALVIAIWLLLIASFFPGSAIEKSEAPEILRHSTLP